MYKVMIVDDEPVILEGLKIVVNWDEYGLKIAGEASNGQSALQQLKSSKYHILITDIRMPEMDGIELIKAARKLDRNLKVIILSGYNDFKQVKEAAKLGIENYLMKPVDEEELSYTLAETVRKLENELFLTIDLENPSNILRQNILNRWVTAGITFQELQSRADILNIRLDHAYYMVSTIKVLDPFTDRASRSEWQPKDKELACFAAANVCSELLKADWEIEIFSGPDHQIVMILHSNSPIERSDFKKSLEKCIHEIHKLLKLDVFATLGSIEEDAERVGDSYAAAASLQDYRMILGPNRVWGEQDVYRFEEGSGVFEAPDYDKMTNLVLALDYTSVCAFLDDIFGKLESFSGVSPMFLKTMATEILLSMCSATKDLKEEFWYSGKMAEEVINRFSHYVTLQQLNHALKRAAGLVIERLSRLHTDMNPLVIRTVKYIEENYMHEISLKTISDLFNTNSIYLGQIFKNELGEVFSHYLSRYRINRAKEMLRSSALSINEISGKVGFQNPSYFISTFRKLAGSSPAEYRKSLLQTE